MLSQFIVEIELEGIAEFPVVKGVKLLPINRRQPLLAVPTHKGPPPKEVTAVMLLVVILELEVLK